MVGVAMSQYFREDQIDELVELYGTIGRRCDELAQAYLLLTYQTEIGKEYGHHGVVRRLMTLEHCITKIYRLLPPQFEGIPDRELANDVTIFIQAFVFHVFGIMDNLACIWVHERGVLGRTGRPLPNGRIGLAADKSEVRESLPVSLRAMLEDSVEWFTYIESFRHSLGHRIPLYIPPFAVRPNKIEEYQNLDTAVDAAIRKQEFNLHDELKRQRDDLRFFRPFMMHSWVDPKPVVFHAQLFADFATVEQFCSAFLEALSNLEMLPTGIGRKTAL